MKNLINFIIIFLLSGISIYSQQGWEQKSSGTADYLYSIDFANENFGFICGANGTILKTTDAGDNWVAALSGTENSLYSLEFINENLGFAVGAFGTALKTIDGGLNWSVLTTNTESNLNSVFFINETTGFIAGNSGIILKTTNGGTDWVAQESGTTNNLTSLYFVNQNLGFAVGYFGSIQKTTNGGGDWNTVQSGVIYPLESVIFVSNTTGYAVGWLGEILKTTNGGGQWNDLTSSLSVNLNSVYFSNENNGYSVGLNGAYIKTTDAGQTWLPINTGFNNQFEAIKFISLNTGFVIGSNGLILKTGNGGESFASPILKSPENGSLGVSNSPELEWYSVYTASSYLVQLSTTYDFSEIAYSLTTTQTSYSLSGLEDSVLFYWRVKAYNGNDSTDWSNIWSFLTSQFAPPIAIYPQNAAASVPTTMAFVWSAIPGAVSYHLQVSTNQNFNTFLINEDNITNNYYIELLLESQFRYFWRLKANYSGGVSEWTNTWYFDTGESVIVTIGNGTNFNLPFTYPAPYGNYNWGSKHQMLIRADELTSQGVSSGIIAALAFSILSLNGINPLDDFTIKIKNTEQNSLTTTFDSSDDWTTIFTSSSYAPNLAISYHIFQDIFIWDGVSNILIETCFNNSSTSFNASCLRTSTPFTSVTYYAANNSNVCSALTGTTSSYRPNITLALIQFPTIDVPTLISPYYLENNIAVNPTFFEWTSVEGATAYDLQISLDPNFSSILFDIPNLTQTEYNLDGLNYSTYYYFRARAKNSEEVSLWSLPNLFFTQSEFSGEHTISLNEGWSTISSFIIPEDADIFNLTLPIFDNLNLIKNNAGEMYVPFYFINTIGSWDYKEAYQIKMSESDELTITGEIASSTENPIELQQGWNYISYLRTSPMDIELALASILTNIVVVKSDTGIFAPASGINTIGTMEPGKGYWVNLSST
ncbi:MAG TPA: YCF48-related protein, partial [Candidatus Kapabacteria bacterium]|nr:YCF48-related protein [Candidatus Kapabacteria bacterium]